MAPGADTLMTDREARDVLAADLLARREASHGWPQLPGVKTAWDAMVSQARKQLGVSS